MQILSRYLYSDNSFSISSSDELVRSFREFDQKKLILPERTTFPIQVQSYYAWREPSQIYSYLVFKLPIWDLPRGVAFKRMRVHGEPTGGLCNWCYSYGSSDEVSLLSLRINSNESSSYFVCNDFSCYEKIQESAARAGRNPDKNLVDLLGKIEKLFENLHRG